MGFIFLVHKMQKNIAVKSVYSMAIGHMNAPTKENMSKENLDPNNSQKRSKLWKRKKIKGTFQGVGLVGLLSLIHGDACPDAWPWETRLNKDKDKLSYNNADNAAILICGQNS